MIFICTSAGCKYMYNTKKSVEAPYLIAVNIFCVISVDSLFDQDIKADLTLLSYMKEMGTVS